MCRVVPLAAGAILSTLIVLIAPVTAAAVQPVVLGTADTAPFSVEDGSGLYDRVLHEAFGRLGIPLEIRRLPSERALQDANAGRIDGEFGRIEAISELYPNLRIVHEPLTLWSFNAFVRQGTQPPESFNDLSDFDVGYIRGWKIYEERVRETRSLTIVATEEQLFAMLQSGRIEVALYNRLRGSAWVARNHSTDIVLAPTPLAVRPMYLFLHQRHTVLIPQLEEALRSIKADGTYERLHIETLGFAP